MLQKLRNPSYWKKQADTKELGQCLCQRGGKLTPQEKGTCKQLSPKPGLQRSANGELPLGAHLPANLHSSCSLPDCCTADRPISSPSLPLVTVLLASLNHRSPPQEKIPASDGALGWRNNYFVACFFIKPCPAEHLYMWYIHAPFPSFPKGQSFPFSTFACSPFIASSLQIPGLCCIMLSVLILLVTTSPTILSCPSWISPPLLLAGFPAPPHCCQAILPQGSSSVCYSETSAGECF